MESDDEESDNSDKKVTPLDLVTHLFFPKKLPQKEHPNLPQIEQTILAKLVTIASPLLLHCSLTSTDKTLQTWAKLQDKSSKELNRKLTGLQDKESVCLFVRRQNCTVLFTKLNEKYTRVITFRSSLPNETITGTCGSVKVTYPETVDVVPTSPLLLSPCFSRQLKCLTQSSCSIAMPEAKKAGYSLPETREPSYPYVISDFLVGMLCPVKESTEFGEMANLDGIKFEKKLRDQVNWEDCKFPFRRSGLWMSAKVILRLCLEEEMKTKQEAGVMHKVILLEILTSLANVYVLDTGASWDICAQLMAKLARRAKKLTGMKKCENSRINMSLEKTLSCALSTIDGIHGLVGRQWKSTIVSASNELEIKPVIRSDQEWIQDCVHEMDDLTSYLNDDRISSAQSDTKDNLLMIDPVQQTPSVTLDSLLERSENLSRKQQDVHLNEQSTWRFQVEWFARHRLNKEHSCDKISKLLFSYSQIAFPLYGQLYSDPVAYSRLTVTVLKFVAILDEIAVQRHPLLRQYQTGIQPEMFDALLIPEKEEMKMVEKLQTYFSQRNKNVLYKNWLGTLDISKNHFSVKFAQGNEPMTLLKSQILEQMKADIIEKQREIERVKKECHLLDQQIAPLSCTRVWSSYYERMQHSSSCYLCKLRSELREKRKSVNCYQRPLPPTEHLQDAVVFELAIPQELAYLRDSVVLLLDEILGRNVSFLPKMEKDNIHTRWTQFRELLRFPKTGHQKLCHLGSETKDMLTSHYASNNPDVNSPESAFILENGLHCRYFREDFFEKTRPPNPFTMNIPQSDKRDGECYQSLQFALNFDRATENDALAKQYQCPQNLTLKEFHTFGSLRSGHRLQLRNLYAGIASKVLSLEREPVLQLKLQTTWELGPKNRAIHVDFEVAENKPFVQAFLQLLSTCGEENATNWNNPLVFLSLTVIALRILEMTTIPEVKVAVSQILYRYRLILEEWCLKLEQLLVKTEDKENTKILMQLLLKSALCCAFTFNASSDHCLPYIFMQPAAITHFLKALSRLHHLVIRENILKENPPSDLIKNLLRHARHGIPLNVQEHLHKVLATPSFNPALHQFVCSKWHDAQNVSVREAKVPKFYHSGSLSTVKKQAYRATYQVLSRQHQVCVDILRGTFFVDGYPPSVLPENIVRNPLYLSFFRTSHFRVQRDSRTFKTADKYRGLDFEFTECKDRLIVQQVCSDGHWFELLPKELFQGKVSHELVDNYTHWFSSKTQAVHFRRPSSSETEEVIERDTEFVLVSIAKSSNVQNLPNEWHLQKYLGERETSQCYLLSISSPGFWKITDNLQKLEHPQFIRILVEKEEMKISVHLWRLHLSFTCRHDGFLYCENYPGYYLPISENGGQNLHTLVGLQSGVVLERKTCAEISGKKRKFVIQHGTVKISTIDYPHQSVVVDTEDGLRSPPYFVFEVDQILKRLRPGNNKSAWLYLALLHGATSSPFLDPFTQLTGTEMAIWILQSGFSWSCSPYDSECLDTLQQISKLSPIYSYYPANLKVQQTMEWPEGLERNSYAAYDGYAIIVQKLLEDSNRLSHLFVEKSEESKEKIEEDEEIDLELCRRSYFRNIHMYNKVAHLSSEFVKSDFHDGHSRRLPSRLGTCDASDLVTLANCRLQKLPSPNRETVSSLIMDKDDPLPWEIQDNLTLETIPTWLTKNLRKNWLRLYSLVVLPNERDLEHELTLILGAILYSGKGRLNQILNLHNIGLRKQQNGVRFPGPLESLTKQPYQPLEDEFGDQDVREILEDTVEKPPEKADTHAQLLRALEQYNSQKKRQVSESVKEISGHWPTEGIDRWTLQRVYSGKSLLNFSNEAHEKINKNLQRWLNNRNLTHFITNVDGILTPFKNRMSTGERKASRREEGGFHYKTVSDVADSWLGENLFERSPEVEANSTTKKIIFNGKPEFAEDHSFTFSEQQTKCLELIDGFLQNVQKLALGDDPVTRALDKAGLHARLAPVTLLRDHFPVKGPLSEGPCLIRAVAVLWAYLKRLNRILEYQTDRTRYAAELARELETQQCDNWSLLDHPEWLLLELELDLTIRRVQVEVARRMMSMPAEKNGVMQLNMGEGKTSVIIPMIVAALSQKKDVLCRVTVLSSIYATNCNLLGATIGGFLNQRLYTFPCSRDLDVASHLDQMDGMYKECFRLGGVVMTLPEYRLSFRLQMYNNFLQDGKADVGLKFHDLELWLRQHARDLVDESDEIFGVKYQLIYTTGKQIPVDGGNLRWTVCQKLLDYLPQVAEKLAEKYGSKVVEYGAREGKENPEKFCPFRILSEECKLDLCEMMAEGILAGKVNLIGGIFSGAEKEIVKEFLTNENISEKAHNRLLEIQGISTEKRQMLLLVSGYLRRGIVFTALKKRWRVEYGVKQGSPGKLMAVPFRAKDVAAERTEFGHPDLAIVLSQLSYYYSGLSDHQLLQCFKVLETSITGPEAVYNSWIKRIPPGKIKSETVRVYKGINLQDYEQKTVHLFPLLRYHKAVIDFWLENVAFPKECKQFPGKLVTNAGDLCYARNWHATTGFSGTNDTSLLLPCQITQQDLQSLKETNVQMEEILERAENRWARSLKMGEGCTQVLQGMVKDDLRVLIDAGALMLELGNEAIAGEWLKIAKNLAGVVYFNTEGEMVIKTRSALDYRKDANGEKDQLLTLSPFKDGLEKCALYLDDQHTRGTDVKLPTSFKACVTVGSGMRRDKLIQACMRMRKLGKGQSVHFYLSHEVDTKIRQELKCDGIISVHDILTWTKHNSLQFEKEGLVYWATNARNYAKNLAADDLFEESSKSAEECVQLGIRCEDPDAQELEGMYGTFHQKSLVTALIPKWFSKIAKRFAEDASLPENVGKMLKSMEAAVVTKCQENIPKREFFHSMLEEEQEKELEPEQEVEEQKYRPPEETPVTPELEPEVRSCVKNMKSIGITEGIARLSEIFKETTIHPKMEGNGWPGNFFATEDFIKVVQPNNVRDGNGMDCFLKTIRYFVSFTNGEDTSVLVLSGHEVNGLIEDIRENNCLPGTTLHMFSAKWMDGQPTFVNDRRLQLPIRQDSTVTLDERVLTPLFLAGGNLYFDSVTEQNEFARFLGFRFRPWTEEEDKAFQRKEITSTGFVVPSCSRMREGCNFQADPREMVLGILKIRNDVLRDTDHVVAILDSCASLFPAHDGGTEGRTTAGNMFPVEE